MHYIVIPVANTSDQIFLKSCSPTCDYIPLSSQKSYRDQLLSNRKMLNEKRGFVVSKKSNEYKLGRDVCELKFFHELHVASFSGKAMFSSVTCRKTRIKIERGNNDGSKVYLKNIFGNTRGVLCPVGIPG